MSLGEGEESGESFGYMRDTSIDFSGSYSSEMNAFVKATGGGEEEGRGGGSMVRAMGNQTIIKKPKTPRADGNQETRRTDREGEK